MSSFGWVVHRVIQDSNIILEVLDARFVEQTRDIKLEQKIKNRNCILITVINKCDYVDKKELEPYKRKLENCVFISAKKRLDRWASYLLNLVRQYELAKTKTV